MKSLAHERPYANELIGAHSTGPVTGGADWICALPEHWIFAGTGMKAGDAHPRPHRLGMARRPGADPGLEVVATRPDAKRARQTQRRHLTPRRSIPARRDNFVFNAATIWWADGLSEPPGYVRPNVYTTAEGPRSARAADHPESARSDDGLVNDPSGTREDPPCLAARVRPRFLRA